MRDSSITSRNDPVPSRLHRFLALVLMFSVQFATLGLAPSACDTEDGKTPRSAAASAHGMHESDSVIDHTDMESMRGSSHAASAAHGEKAAHDCSHDQGATETTSHPMHCELAAPCGSLLFTTAGNPERMMVVVEHHDTMMPERYPAATLPAPDAPPPRA